jgi:hypothetical protein
MRIRLRTTIAGPLLAAGPGDIVTVAPALVAALIEAGCATPESDGPERALPPPPETATTAPQRRRHR